MKDINAEIFDDDDYKIFDKILSENDEPKVPRVESGKKPTSNPSGNESKRTGSK